MTIDLISVHSLEVIPCARDPRCYRWIIRAGGGTVVEHSPYAFVTQNGARISGECWIREHFVDGARG